METAIVTGATGMVGTALIQTLLSHGVRVKAIIRPNSPRATRLDKRVEIFNADLSELNSIDERALKATLFFHLGWAGTERTQRENPEIQAKNIGYTLDACKLAARAGCRKFLFAGSQAEHGAACEKISPTTKIAPEVPYGIAKFAASELGKIECSHLGLTHIHATILSVYGPHDGEGTMISKAMRALIRGEEFPTTLGEQIWDYLYEEDCGELLYALALNGKSGVRYPVGSGEGRQLKQFLAEIGEVTSENALIKYGAVPYPNDQKPYLCADMSVTEETTGFKPKISFQEGIKKVYRHHLSIFGETDGERNNKCNDPDIQ